MGQPQDTSLIPHNHPSSTCSNKSLVKAEEISQNILSKIQPNQDSELIRNAVSNYFNFLLRLHFGIQVHPYGSGPLKTYLPDGDIDLTALTSEDMAKDVLALLQREQQNTAGVFIVKDIQYICAHVKLIKCLVRSMVVDISFNQHGGLCTLSFLEEIDRIIGQDHLFKRSIILTKAWCYYESRVLGAHHGLISTYALETMIIYIFQVFRTPPRGPLEALYRFLDYFSRFDWDKYCVSLNGPVILSSLPQVIVKKPDIDAAPPLLSEEYLKCYVERISRGVMGPESSPRPFLKKHLNIMDPLKENNNLGRSVSQANYFRIRSAFSHGARTLRQILLLPETSIPREVANFFKNTVDRIRRGQRIQVPVKCYDNTFGAPPPFHFGPQGLPFSPCAEAFCGHQVSKMCRRRTLLPHNMVDSMLECPTVKTDDFKNREEKKLVNGRRCNSKPLVSHHGNLQPQRSHCNSEPVMLLRDTSHPKENTHQLTPDSLQDVFLETKKSSHHEILEQRPRVIAGGPKKGSCEISNNYLQKSTDRGAMVLCNTKSRKKPTHQGDNETRSPKDSNYVRSQDSKVKTSSMDLIVEIERAAGPSYHLPDVNQFPPLSATRT